MLNKNKTLFFFLLISFFQNIVLAQFSDTRFYIQTPRGTDVPDTYQTSEFPDSSERAYYDWEYSRLYPNAIQIKLPGESYSSTKTFNCHGYAWRYVDYGQRLWIGYNYPGAEEVFWNDGSYDEVSEAVCTKISYTDDHSAVPSGTANYYYSKWKYYPLMYHNKDDTPGYGTTYKFFRRSIDIPQDLSSIQSAINNAASGQTINVSNSQTLTGPVLVPSGIILNFTSTASINFNGYCIVSNGGTILYNALTPAAILETGSVINGVYPTIQTALNIAISGQSIELYGAMNLTANVLIPTGLSLYCNSSVNLNNYSIISAGGYISGSNAVGLRALLKNGTILKGMCSSINTACSYANTSYSVEVQSGTFSENISLSNKTNVTISGNGAGISTIDGSVSFGSSQGCTLTNLTITGNISLSYGTSDNYLSHLTVQGNIQPSMGSHSDIRYVDLTNSGSVGISAGYCNSWIESCPIRNKNAEGVYATGMNMTIVYCTFCCNGPTSNRLDVYSPSSSPDIYLHTDEFSASPERSTIVGNYIHYDTWRFCGIPKIVSTTDNSSSFKELPSVWDKLSETKKLTGIDDYQKLIENRRNIFDKIRKENEGSKTEYKQYAKELTALISQFRVIIQKYPGSAASINALQEIIDFSRLLKMNKEAKELVNNLLNNDIFVELNSQIKILSIPLLVDEQDYDGALSLFNEIINEIPNTSEASFLLYNKAALLEIYKNENEGAKTIYNQLLKQNPNSIWSSLAAEKLEKTIIPKQAEVTKKDKGFSLDNYPNPFNPVTTIKYRIPENGFVTLKIFDALGREIKTLVSEYKSGGEYSVDFNASGLVSGVYISQLRMNDFVQSKKMILLK